jgi:hypothetical protein
MPSAPPKRHRLARHTARDTYRRRAVAKHDSILALGNNDARGSIVAPAGIVLVDFLAQLMSVNAYQ